MSLYSILGHPLLRCPAGVTPQALEAHARVAERVLGLVGTAYSDADAASAADAVAYQVNDQLDGPASGVKSETHGIETWIYTGEGVAINTIAAAIVAQLATEAAEETPEGTFAALTSLR